MKTDCHLKLGGLDVLLALVYQIKKSFVMAAAENRHCAGWRSMLFFPPHNCHLADKRMKQDCSLEPWNPVLVKK